MGRGIKIILITGLLIVAVVGISVYWSEITTQKPTERAKVWQEKVKDVLGSKAEKGEGGQKESFRAVLEGKAQTVVQSVERKITQALFLKSGKEMAEILKNLPPDQQKEVKKEFCRPE